MVWQHDCVAASLWLHLFFASMDLVPLLCKYSFGTTLLYAQTPCMGQAPVTN